MGARRADRCLPRLARRAGCDLVHSLASTARPPDSFVRVTTIHDLIISWFPKAHFGLARVGMRALIPAVRSASHRVLADSVNTRDDLARRLRVPPEKVDMVPLGLGRPPRGPVTPEPELRARLGLGDRPVVFSLSAKRPHKNLAGLIDALAVIPPERRPVAVLPGYATPYEAELRERAVRLGLADDVRFLGWTPDEDVEGLFRLASVFVFPSFYEGFGLPVLEAMARGIPVATSDRASLPEVAGDAALFFDPDDPASIATSIERVLGDGELADRLMAAGRERAALFTWERTAQLTLAAYERALSGGRQPARGSSPRD